jgi:hypothetical protein
MNKIRFAQHVLECLHRGDFRFAMSYYSDNDLLLSLDANTNEHSGWINNIPRDGWLLTVTGMFKHVYLRRGDVTIKLTKEEKRQFRTVWAAEKGYRHSVNLMRKEAEAERKLRLQDYP